MLSDSTAAALVVIGATLIVSDAIVIAPLIAVLVVFSSILGDVMLILLGAVIVLFATSIDSAGSVAALIVSHLIPSPLLSEFSH